MRVLYFFPVNLSVKSESPSLPSAKGTGQKLGHIGGVACLLVFWAAFSAVTALVVIAVFVPGHLGLSDWLKMLSHFWPSDSPMFTT
jgi:hypothetical protein